jgi:hypothetical protein
MMREGFGSSTRARDGRPPNVPRHGHIAIRIRIHPHLAKPLAAERAAPNASELELGHDRTRAPQAKGAVQHHRARFTAAPAQCQDDPISRIGSITDDTAQDTAAACGAPHHCLRIGYVHLLPARLVSRDARRATSLTEARDRGAADHAERVVSVARGQIRARAARVLFILGLLAILCALIVGTHSR